MKPKEALWKRVAAGLAGCALMVVWIVVLRESELFSPEFLREWGTWLAVAPFLVAGVVMLALRRRRDG